MFCECVSVCADAATNTAFIAIASVDRGMLKGHPSDGLGPDTLQMEVNPCGVIFSLKLNDQFEATSAQVCYPHAQIYCSIVAVVVVVQVWLQ